MLLNATRFFYFYTMNLLSNPAFILRFTIAIAYIFLGALLLFSSIKISVLSNTNQYALAALLVVYGVFRMYRAIKILKEEEN